MPGKYEGEGKRRFAKRAGFCRRSCARVLFVADMQITRAYYQPKLAFSRFN